MTTPKQVSGTIKADARAALEELANMPLGIPLEDWCRLSSRILAAIQPDPEPQPVAVAWPDGFFVLPVGGGARLRECATEGCCQHCSIRVEHGGIGSDYCEPCARKIAAPSIAGTVSVEVAEAFKPFFGDPVMEGLLWPDATPDSLVTIRVQKRIYDRARAALRALAGKMG